MQKRLIAPFAIGLENDMKPWITQEDAMERLDDCYIYQGRIKKRFGYRLILGSLYNSMVGSTIGNSGESGTVELDLPVDPIDLSIGQIFWIGEKRYIITSRDPLEIDPNDGVISINTETKKIQVKTDPNTAVRFSPGLPITGLRLRELFQTNFEEMVAFDPILSYHIVGDKFEALKNKKWTASDSHYMWTVNYRGQRAYETYLYAVNYHGNDGIAYLPSDSDSWTTIFPKTSDGKLKSSRMLIGFRNHLIAINTIEDVNEGNITKENKVFPSRARWSQFGDPRNEDTSWQNKEGRGGFIDAPTRQNAISCAVVGGQLIVGFERSTWELRYRGDPFITFEWILIDPELGIESTFSHVSIGNTLIGVGNVAVTQSTPSNVRRIDQKIPKEVYKYHNCCQNIERIYGIRDHLQELIYWSVPDQQNKHKYPNKILVYNYNLNTWSYFNDSFTCYGYYQKRTGMTWKKVGQFYPTWASWKMPWRSGRTQSAFPEIAAGNQQGIVFVIEQENNTNAPSLIITSISANQTITSKNHNLNLGDFVRFEPNGIIAKVNRVIDSDHFQVDEEPTANAQMMRRVSNWLVVTKQFNPTTAAGLKFIFTQISFLLDITKQGEMIVDYLTNSGLGSTIRESAVDGVIYGDMRLFSKPEDLDDWTEIERNYSWHDYFPQEQGNFIQLIIKMSDEQMKNWSISSESFVLHGILLHLKARGRIA